MIIKNFLKSLDYLSDDVIIKNVALEGGSDRSCYGDFCLVEKERNNKVTVKELREFILNEVIGKIFIGYKGGDFRMDKYSTINLGYPHCGGYTIDGILIDEDGITIKKQRVLYY